MLDTCACLFLWNNRGKESKQLVGMELIEINIRAVLIKTARFQSIRSITIQ